MATRLNPRRCARRSSLDVDVENHFGLGDEEFRIWMLHPDDPAHIHTVGDAIELAADVPMLPVEREVLVLLDDERRVVALLLDPPAVLGVMIGRAPIPGLADTFTTTLCIVVSDDAGPTATDHQRTGFHALRRFHALQGLRLLDVVLTDGTHVHSLAGELDPDPSWDEPYDAAT